MKTLFRLPLLLALASATLLGVAQDDDAPRLSPERLKEIKAQKAAYLTAKLGFTADEAQRFWPVYNAFDEAREANRSRMRELHRTARAADSTLTEAKAKEILAKTLELREAEVKLERDYSDRFQKAIGAVKTVELAKAERGFQREVLRRFGERAGERRGPGQRPGPPAHRR